MNVLILTAPYCKKLYIDTIKAVFPNATITTISDFRYAADIWAGSFIYTSKFDEPELFDSALVDDIVCRDRTLNVIERDKAYRIVKRCYNGLNTVFSKGSFDFMLSAGIDRYFRDIAFRLADEHEVYSVSVFGSFYSGYAWFTRRGERIPLMRDVSELEIDRLCSTLLQSEYLPHSEEANILRTSRTVRKLYFRRKLIETVYYPLRRFTSRDWDNAQYNVVTYPKGRHLSDYFSKNYGAFFTKLDDIGTLRTTDVYLPMHLIPEAATSYWCKDVARQGYLGYLLSIIDSSSADIRFLIKEHPSMMGRRELTFYEELRKRKNVLLIHPQERSNILLEKVDTVAVDTGTVGVEALMRGKRALCFADSYYSDIHPNAERVNSITLELLKRPPIVFDERIFARNLLDGWFVSDFVNNKSQASCSSEQLAAGLRLLCSTYGNLLKGRKHR